MSGYTRKLVMKNGETFPHRGRTIFAGADAASTVTAAMIAGGAIKATPTASRTYTLDTAALLIANAALSNMDIGDMFEFTVINMAAATHPIVVAVATGITHVGVTANLTVAATVSRNFGLVRTGAATFDLVSNI